MDASKGRECRQITSDACANLVVNGALRRWKIAVSPIKDQQRRNDSHKGKNNRKNSENTSVRRLSQTSSITCWRVQQLLDPTFWSPKTVPRRMLCAGFFLICFELSSRRQLLRIVNELVRRHGHHSRYLHEHITQFVCDFPQLGIICITWICSPPGLQFLTTHFHASKHDFAHHLIHIHPYQTRRVQWSRAFSLGRYACQSGTAIKGENRYPI